MNGENYLEFIEQHTIILVSVISEKTMILGRFGE